MAEKKGTCRVAVVDTLTSLQNDEYMSIFDSGSMVLLDTYRDFTVAMYMFILELRKLDCEIILVLGPEGSGKTFGMKYLDPNTTVYFNADKKPLSFKEGDKWYNLENGNMYLPKTYREIIQVIREMNKDKVDPNKRLIVFLIGHTMVFEAPGTGKDKEMREKLRAIGKFSDKMNIEGAVVNTFYTNVTMEKDKPKFQLRTQTTGKNTGRTKEGLFEDLYIPNNFQMIVDALWNY